MAPTKELIDEIYRARVLHARSTPPEAKILDAIRLFRTGCEFMKSGIRSQHPEADEAEVMRLLEVRLALARRLDRADDR
jgi:hypothetical protein